ncbi:WYL domain-containing protein [Propionibacterium freudenreichii]|uniref:helix-turn-helix transcriptional regulator n=1 Tax=Propionibacterium freudenreichii TaxID=1744 RepID=UPI002434591F|nr:WYL domain-containing protein [Propionibacterium freudenreichii]WFF30901.1 WYL domain-containing protein [Propionibacterium freudenreichii]
MENPSSRSLRLLALLQSGRVWSAAEIAEHLAVAHRTVRRDVARLRSLGYDIRSSPGPGGAYQLVPGIKIPPLLLDADEVCLLVIGLLVLEAGAQDTSVTAVLTKLEQLLPPTLRRRALATAMATQVLTPVSASVDWRLLSELAEAVSDGRCLHFTYTDQHGCVSERRVHPHRHVLRCGNWYLIGYDTQRNGWRLFRLDRIQNATLQVNLTGQEPPMFPSECIEDWLTSDFGRQTDSDS